MEKLHFRCVKVEIDEKVMRNWVDGEVKMETTITATCMFNCVESMALLDLITHGWISVNLPIEKFREFGYEVGKVYELTPM